MKNVKFNKNWNNKLYCMSFSTVRLSSSTKFKEGEIYRIWENDISKGTATLMCINEFLLANISPAMCLLDTNYEKDEYTKMFKKMYQKKRIDFSKKKLMFLVFKYQNETPIISS